MNMHCPGRNMLFLLILMPMIAPICGQACGGEYNSSSGMIRHPYSGGDYQDDEECTWIIRSSERINITVVKLDLDYGDFLSVRDGDSFDANVLRRLERKDRIPWPFQTSTNVAHLFFSSDGFGTKTGFELYWEPAVETFYQVHTHSDYEVRLNFSANPQPTLLEWSYGANFQEMPNLIQVPSDNGKFSTSLIDLENGTYQALLYITGITEEDIQTKFKLHVRNEIGDTYYRAIFSAFPPPPSSLQFSDITPTSIRIKWNYNVNPINISNYVIEYKYKSTQRYKSDQEYTEMAAHDTMFYNFRGLESGLYQFQVLAVDEFGRGPLTEPLYVSTSKEGCGGEYNTSSGKIWYPFTGENYYNNRQCTWIIRTRELIKITFISFDINDEYGGDYLYIRDGDNIDSNVLGNFTGNNIPGSIQTTTNAANLLFISNELNYGKGFELYWEPGAENFYQIPLHSDYEVKLNFSANPQPTTINWFYGSYFLELHNIIQVPSDNGKYSTSLINLGNGNYQAVLRIIGVTEEDLDTKFNLYVVNENIKNNYRVKLSAYPPPPSSLQISNIMPRSVRVTWNYNINPGNISSYIIQYKSRNSTCAQDYRTVTETNIYTVRGLTPSTEYELRVLSANKIGHGLPSYTSYFTTAKIGCGGEFTSSSGMIRHPVNTDSYPDNQKCTWTIRAALGTIKITFDYFDIDSSDYLYIRDGEMNESNLLGKFRDNDTKSVHTTTNAAHLFFTSNRWGSHGKGFVLRWEFTDAPIQTFYDVQLHNDYEVRFNFSANPQPTALKWSYGANFQEMPNLIQVPSDNGKFSTSLIDLEHGQYQAVLRIAGITLEEYESKFNLYVANEIAETNYKVTFSDCPEGSIATNSSHHCLKIFKDNSRNGEEAKEKCAEEGLRLAKPTDELAFSLRKVLLDTYGDTPVWLDTCNWLDDCPDWNKFAWELAELYFGLKRDNVTTDHCLAMLVEEYTLERYPKQPYIPINCTEQIYTLCEGRSF